MDDYTPHPREKYFMGFNLLFHVFDDNQKASRSSAPFRSYKLLHNTDSRNRFIDALKGFVHKFHSNLSFLPFR